MNNIKIFAFADEASSSIDGQINAMLRNNLHGLEIRGVDGDNVADITLKKAKEVKQKLDDNGLITWSIGSPIGKMDINGDFASHKEKLKHILEIANVLSCDNIRVFSFYIPENEDANLYRNKATEYLSELCEIAKPYGVSLCHENEKGIYGDLPDRCLELFDTIPHLKGIFDPANFVQCGADTLKAWTLLKKHIHYIHIKDSKTDGTIVPAGYGDGNIAAIAKDFISAGGNCFTMEPHLATFDGLAALERENEKSIVSGLTFENNDVAFDTACTTFKGLLKI